MEALVKPSSEVPPTKRLLCRTSDSSGSEISMISAYDNSDITLVNKLFDIRSSSAKGLGMFATALITSGTVVLSEAPLVRLDNGSGPRKVKRAFHRLSEEHQKCYMSLFSIHGLSESLSGSQLISEIEDPAKRARQRKRWKARQKPQKSIYSVWLANCMSAGQGVGVFLEASRINHACIPNAIYMWNQNSGVQEIRAVKQILDGEVYNIT
jgi:SET domain